MTLRFITWPYVTLCDFMRIHETLRDFTLHDFTRLNIKPYGPVVVRSLLLTVKNSNFLTWLTCPLSVSVPMSLVLLCSEILFFLGGVGGGLLMTWDGFNILLPFRCRLLGLLPEKCCCGCWPWWPLGKAEDEGTPRLSGDMDCSESGQYWSLTP